MRFIATADWHLRQELPRCRLDSDWLDTQRARIRAVASIASDYGVPTIHTGDLFHHPRVATEVVNMCLSELNADFPYGFFLMAGNHDLPYHSLDNIMQSSIGTILQLVRTPGCLPDIDWAHFGCDAPGTAPIRLVHRLIWPDAKSRPDVIEDVGQTAEELLAEFPASKWIIAGDYHHAFHVEIAGRHVINPGCLTIQAADMIGYVPGVYLVDTIAESVAFIQIPDNGQLVTDAYLKESDARDERIGALVAKLEAGTMTSLDFDENVDRCARTLSPEAQEVLHRIRLETLKQV